MICFRNYFSFKCTHFGFKYTPYTLRVDLLGAAILRNAETGCVFLLRVRIFTHLYNSRLYLNAICCPYLSLLTITPTNKIGHGGFVCIGEARDGTGRYI